MATKKTDFQKSEEKNIQAASRSKGQKITDMLTGNITYPSGGAGRGYVNPAWVNSDNAEMPRSNSREQYNAEKAAGGALSDLSFEEWKKL